MTVEVGYFCISLNDPPPVGGIPTTRWHKGGKIEDSMNDPNLTQRWHKPGYPDEKYGCIERIAIFAGTRIRYKYRITYGVNMHLPDGSVIKGLCKCTRSTKKEAQEVLRREGFVLYYDTKSNRSNLSVSRKG